MQPTIEFQDSLSPAILQAFSASRRKPDLAKAVNYAMQIMVSFALGGIGSADPGAISRYMTKAGRGVRRGRRVASGVVADRFRGSIAAAIVAAALKRPESAKSQRLKWLMAAASTRGVVAIAEKTGAARGRVAAGSMRAAKKKSDAARFYELVRIFEQSSKSSPGYMRAGLVPALRLFKAKTGSKFTSKHTARIDRHPGTATEATKDTLTAVATNYARSIAEVYPAAFEKSLTQTERWLEKVTWQNMAALAVKNGLTVSGTF